MHVAQTLCPGATACNTDKQTLYSIPVQVLDKYVYPETPTSMRAVLTKTAWDQVSVRSTR